MQRTKPLFHGTITQLLHLRGSLRMWLSVEKDKFDTHTVGHVSPSPMGRNKCTNNRGSQSSRKQVKAVATWSVTSLDWPFTLGPGVTCQTGQPVRLSGWPQQGSLLSRCHHVSSLLFMSRGDTGHDGVGSAPSLGCKNYLFSTLCCAASAPRHSPFLFGHAPRMAFRIPAFSDSLLVFGLAVCQGNRRAFSERRWVWGRSLVSSPIF